MCFCIHPAQMESGDIMFQSVSWPLGSRRYTLPDVYRSPLDLDNIAFYSGWLTYGSRLLYPHVPERVMRVFNYMQFVSKDPSESSPPAIRHRDVDAMYYYYLIHLVSNEARGSLAPSNWSTAYGYIQWYFRVSHPYMTDTPSDPLRSAHQEILEGE